MKKILLLFVLINAVWQLKAQQLLPVQPTDSLSNNLDKYLKIKPDSPFQLFKMKPNPNETLSNFIASKVGHMAVVVLDGNSKMPIKKIGGYYTMPVKRIGSEDQLPGGQNFFPGLPTFKTP